MNGSGMKDFRGIEVTDACDFFLVEQSGFHRSIERAKASDPIDGIDSERVGS